jgi:hypothetical protein
LGLELLSDQQVTLRYSAALVNDKELSDWLCWDFVSKPLIVSALPSYQRYHRDLVAELENKLAYDHHRLNEAVDEYLDHGVSYFRNFYANVLGLHGSYFGNNLFGRFQNVPAIICGAGPSLQKALPLLESLRNKAIILAGGSAINALNAFGLQPHFGVGIDPNSAQYQRYVSQSAYETPFFYRLRLNHQALRLLHGPRLFLTGGGGYVVAAGFEAALGLEGDDLDEGHNVVNLATSIAHALGCSPIIYAGLDLAYTDMKAYAPGIVHQAQVEEKAIVGAEGIDRAAVVRADIHGKPIYTLWKWIAESEWLATFAREHSETIFLNATEAGLGVHGVANLSLKSASDEFLPEEHDIEGMIWTASQEACLPPDAKERLDIGWNELDASLSRCLDKFEVILSELQSLWHKISSDSEASIELTTGLMAVTGLELEEEVAYCHVLAIFNEVYIRTLNREIRQLKVSEATRQQKQLKQLELETRRYAFLKETARVNREIMRECLEEVST